MRIQINIVVFSNVARCFSDTPYSTKQKRNWKEVCSLLSTRAVEWKIATWGLFIKGKFRASQMCSNFSKQLKLTIALANCPCCKAPVCKYLPKSLFFLSQFFLLSPTARQKITLADSQVCFVLFFPWYSHLGLPCLFYLSRLSVPKLQEATGVFKSSKSFLK